MNPVPGYLHEDLTRIAQAREQACAEAPLCPSCGSNQRHLVDISRVTALPAFQPTRNFWAHWRCCDCHNDFRSNHTLPFAPMEAP